MAIDLSSTVASLNTNYESYANTKASSLESKLGSTDYSTASDDELMEVCKDFESYFVEQVLKSMEKMAKIDSDDDDSSSSLFSSLVGVQSDDSAMSTMSSYFGDEMVSQYASLMTESNQGKGLGIAQALYEQMKRNYSVSTVDVSSNQTDTDSSSEEEAIITEESAASADL